jgi:CheY-like chemotaxis protein
MRKEVKIILAEDNQGHATLIRKNLKRAGIMNDIIHFADGQQTLDYLFKNSKELNRESGVPHLLLLDIKMPKVDGFEVLKEVKKDKELRKIPVIMITTTDDPQEVEKCHKMGCSSYITKPIDYDKFVESIRKLGLFLMVVEVPKVNGEVE